MIRMTTIICGRTITLDASQLDPGAGESWVVDSPILYWGDGSYDDTIRGTTISYTYPTIGDFVITLDGENTCGKSCRHEEEVLVIESPADIVVTNVTTTTANIRCSSVPGTDGYYWELWHGGSKVTDDRTTTNSVEFSGLTPNTTYSVYASTIVGLVYSEYYCGECSTDFTTPSDTCNLPICRFTIS
jgi:hypothetical protein